MWSQSWLYVVRKILFRWCFILVNPAATGLRRWFSHLAFCWRSLEKWSVLAGANGREERGGGIWIPNQNRERFGAIFRFLSTFLDDVFMWCIWSFDWIFLVSHMHLRSLSMLSLQAAAMIMVRVPGYCMICMFFFRFVNFSRPQFSKWGDNPRQHRQLSSLHLGPRVMEKPTRPWTDTNSRSNSYKQTHLWAEAVSYIGAKNLNTIGLVALAGLCPNLCHEFKKCCWVYSKGYIGFFVDYLGWKKARCCVAVPSRHSLQHLP